MNSIRDFPNVQELLFGSKKKKKPDKFIVDRLVMMLITCRLIGYKLINIARHEVNDNLSKKDDGKLVAFLNTNDHGEPLIFQDINWRRLPLK